MYVFFSEDDDEDDDEDEEEEERRHLFNLLLLYNTSRILHVDRFKEWTEYFLLSKSEFYNSIMFRLLIFL